MSIDRIKKQAKLLSKLLPAHLKNYPVDPAALSACQELAAKSNGYPSFHAAASKDESANTGTGNTSGPNRQPINTGGANFEYSSPALYDQGKVEYGNEKTRRKAHYWVADVGFKLDQRRPVSILFVEPDTYDEALNTDDRLREEIVTSAAQAEGRNSAMYDSPTSVCLVIRPPDKPVYGLCFHYVLALTLNGSVTLQDDADAGVDLSELFANKVLNPYQRFLMREVIRSLNKADMRTSRTKVLPSARPWEFWKLLNQMYDLSDTVVRLGKPAGLAVSVTYDSWLLDAMLDMHRFCPALASLLATLHLPDKKQKVAVSPEYLGEHWISYGTSGASKKNLSDVLKQGLDVPGQEPKSAVVLSSGSGKSTMVKAVSEWRKQSDQDSATKERRIMSIEGELRYDK